MASNKHPSCHPNKPYFAKDQCKSCYMCYYKKTHVNTVSATCHPSEPHTANGLCRSCYEKKYMSRYRVVNKDKMNSYKREYRKTHKDYIRSIK